MAVKLKTISMNTGQQAVKTTYFSILSNASLALIKGLAGYSGNSFALIADAIESTTDIFSSVLVLFGLKYASKPADSNHPYGHGRIEPLITFLVAGFLIVSATIIAWESIRNISTPHAPPKAWTLVILGAVIVWKEISYRIVMRKSRETNSSSLRADAWHHRSDAITSVAAFAGILVATIFGEGYETADDWAALFASGFILYNCYRIFRPALGEIMDENTYDDFIEEIRAVSKSVDKVLYTEKCFVRKSGLKFHVDLHVTVDKNLTVKEGHDIAHKLNSVLKESLPQIDHVLIHVEPGG
jgi:cation diffusion facilitator family transporter